MKRDMDLVRKLLFELEKKGRIIAAHDTMVIEGEDYDEHAIEYHLRILADSPYVMAEYSGIRQITHYRLTWQGHEFIDAVRSDTIWSKVKGTLHEVGGYTYPIMLQLAEKLLLKQASEILKPLGF